MEHIQFLPACSAVAKYLWGFFNSNFFTAFAGAGAGAYGAQVIITRLKNKENLLKEIRDTNVAISLALQITNVFFTFKSQHFKELYENYLDDKKRALDSLNGQDIKFEQYNKPIELLFQKDFKAFNPVAVPIESLKNTLFDNLSMNTKSILAMCELEQSVCRFNSILLMRNNLIKEEMGAQKTLEQKQSLHEMLDYFGIDIGNESVNTVYSDILESLDIDIDSSLFYGVFLIGELVKHGKALVEKSGNKSLKINDPNFSKAVKGGLMPKDSNYDNWKSMFIS